MAIPRISARNQASSYIRERKPFNSHGAMRATDNPSLFTFSWLGGEDRKRYEADREDPGIDYVVISYETPIAWHRKDGLWVRPATKYSMTTSHHQGRCPVDGTRD